MAEIHVVSVRTLAEYACASGSLTSGAMMARRMREGREGHQAVQSLLPPCWQAEAPVTMDVELEGVWLRVQGVPGLYPACYVVFAGFDHVDF